MRVPRAGHLCLTVLSSSSQGECLQGPRASTGKGIFHPSLGMQHSCDFGKQLGWPFPGQLRLSYVQPSELYPLVLPFTLPVFLWYRWFLWFSISYGCSAAPQSTSNLSDGQDLHLLCRSRRLEMMELLWDTSACSHVPKPGQSWCPCPTAQLPFAPRAASVFTC